MRDAKTDRGEGRPSGIFGMFDTFTLYRKYINTFVTIMQLILKK